MPTCPSCSKNVPPQVLCIYCGKHLSPQITCPGCKRQMPKRGPSCQYCGSNFDGSQPAPEPAPQPTPKPVSKPEPEPQPATAAPTPAERRAGEAAGMTEMARGIATEHKRRREFNRVWKLVEGILFIAALPLILPSLVITAAQVRKWGQIPVVITLIDAAFLLAVSATLDNNLAFYGVLVGCAATMVLFISRTMQGKVQGGIFLGYSGITTLVLIAGGVLFFPSLVVVSVAAEPTTSYGVLGVSVLLIAFAAFRASGE